MDDDYKKNLLPTDFKDWKQVTGAETMEDYEDTQLTPFIKATLIRILRTDKATEY